MHLKAKHFVTALIVLVAVVIVLVKTWTHLSNPWTRDGQVQANIIEIVPRVSGPLVALPVRDNQFVHAGDLLFQIDPRTYQASLDQAKAQVDQVADSLAALTQGVESAKAGVSVARSAIDQARSSVAQTVTTIAKYKIEYERQSELLKKKATSQKAFERAQATYEVGLEEHKVTQAAVHKAEAGLLQAEAALAESRARLGAAGEANPQLRQALAALRQADLNLEFTQVRAPADGYVTHLRQRIGSHVVANQPALALVDSASWWVDGYFMETQIADLKSGDQAMVTLMSDPGTPVAGVVDSIGWGISQQDGSTGGNLLPRVSPTFEWIRLAQRIPVRVHLVDLPPSIHLRVGTTCSVLVRKGTAPAPATVPVAR